MPAIIFFPCNVGNLLSRRARLQELGSRRSRSQHSRQLGPPLVACDLQHERDRSPATLRFSQAWWPSTTAPTPARPFLSLYDNDNREIGLSPQMQPFTRERTNPQRATRLPHSSCNADPSSFTDRVLNILYGFHRTSHLREWNSTRE